mgnify:CR=1 FL=1
MTKTFRHLINRNNQIMQSMLQNTIGALVLNLAAWHGYTKHETSLDTWIWLLVISAIVIVRDIAIDWYFARMEALEDGDHTSCS